MSAPAGQVPAPGIPLPYSKSEAQAAVDQWPPAEVAAAALHLSALGATERDAMAVLTVLAHLGVRRIGPYVSRFDEGDLERWRGAWADAQRAVEEEASRALASKVLVIRKSVRWPWRVSTGQAWHYNDHSGTDQERAR